MFLTVKKLGWRVLAEKRGEDRRSCQIICNKELIILILRYFGYRKSNFKLIMEYKSIMSAATDLQTCLQQIVYATIKSAERVWEEN